MREYDLVVIGAGPGGYEAALEAAGVYGMKTALIEKEALGGTCLNHGCIPTKALLHSAELFHQMKECSVFGLDAEGVSFDMERIQSRKTEVVDTLRSGVAAMMKQKKVEVIKGSGRILDSHSVEVQGEEKRILDTEYILIATGSRAFVPPIPGAGLKHVVTSDELLEKRDGLYGHLVIIGGGVIGMEFASVYRAFGSEVTVIEALPKIISNMDRELSQSLKMLMKKRGVGIITGASVTEIREEGEGLVCEYREKDQTSAVSCDGVLICVGRRPFTEGLFGPDVSVEMDRGRIVTDENGCTSMPGVYAAGDVCGGIMLAHAATAMGRNAVAHMYACMKPEDAQRVSERRIADHVIPGCIYTDPEIASVGLTPEQAKTQGIDAASRKIVMSANGKTVLTGGERGFIKVVYEKQTEKILGAVMMCARASDLIGEFADAVVNGLTLSDMGRVVRPHPSFSEGITEVCRQGGL